VDDLNSRYTATADAQFANLYVKKQTALRDDRERAPEHLCQEPNGFQRCRAQSATPLSSIYQLAKISRADENIVKAKGGAGDGKSEEGREEFLQLGSLPGELISAQAATRKIQAKWLTASNSCAPKDLGGTRHGNPTAIIEEMQVTYPR